MAKRRLKLWLLKMTKTETNKCWWLKKVSRTKIKQKKQ